MVWNHSSRVVASAQDKKDQDQVSCDWSTARGGRVLWRTFQVTTTRDRPFFVSTPILRAFQFTQNPMANHDDKNDNHDESSPLLGKQVGEEDAKKAGKPTDAKADTATVTVDKAPAPAPGNFGGYGWTADGLPLGHGSVVGEPMGRAHWDSSLFACLGRTDEFCSSDLEVCESFWFFY
jgi:hypothetical protein